MSDTNTHAQRLSDRRCQACEGGVPPLDDLQINGHLAEIHDDWQRDGQTLVRQFKFQDYHHVMAFVNAVAWIAHMQNHHPDMAVGFKDVTVRYTTHAIGGLSDNDFICAAKVDALLDA